MGAGLTWCGLETQRQNSLESFTKLSSSCHSYSFRSLPTYPIPACPGNSR